MPKRPSTDDYELRSEYDLAKMTIMPKGRYAPSRRAGKNVALLAPDVARAFPTDETVNEALRLIMQIAKVPNKRKPKSVRTTKARTVPGTRLSTRRAS